MPESSSDNFENLRRQAIESALWIPEDASDDLKRAKARSSLYRFLLNEITKSAKQEAVAGGRTNFSLSMTFLPKPSRSLPIFNGLLSVSQTLPILARIGISGSTNKTHFIASKRRTSHILIDQVLSSAATRYLNSSLRCVAIDRLLVDALLAQEIFAFGDEMWNPDFRNTSPITQSHVLWSYIKRHFFDVVTFGAIIAFTVWLQSRDIIGATATAWTIGIALVLFLLALIVSTFYLPRLWWRQANARRRVTKLMQDMILVYSELQSEGAISAHHVRMRAQKTTDEGVRWSATLFAVLDDIISRTGRF